ncbi:MAG TPA: hypothetical protein VFW38_08115 [Solirubrobacteraceae bacterium]|nr:hypothetical protein [Solirubrobacteraceae bacterium]
MALDNSKLAKAAADQMDDLERRYGDGDYELGEVCTTVEVIGPDGSETGLHSSSLPNAQPAIFLLRSALNALERTALGGADQDPDINLIFEFEITDSERAVAMQALENPLLTFASIAANNGYKADVSLSRIAP